MIKILKNTTLSPISLSDVGITIPASSQHLIDPTEYGLFAKSTDTIGYLSSGDIVMNNGTLDLVPLEGIAWLQGDFILNTGATSLTILRPVLNSEYELVLPDRTKSVSIKSTNSSVLTVALSSGSATVWTIPSNNTWDLNSLFISSTSLYINSSIQPSTVEIIITHG